MQNRRIQGFLPRMRRLLYSGERESGLFAGVFLFLFILLLVNVVDILGRAASEIIGSAELALVNQTEERVNNVALQLCAADFLDNRNSLLEIHALAVRTVGIHRIEGVGDSYDLRHTRNFIAL